MSSEIEPATANVLYFWIHQGPVDIYHGPGLRAVERLAVRSPPKSPGCAGLRVDAASSGDVGQCQHLVEMVDACCEPGDCSGGGHREHRRGV